MKARPLFPALLTLLIFLGVVRHTQAQSEIRIHTIRGFEQLNPLHTFNHDDLVASNHVFERLLKLNPTNFDIQPSLAEALPEESSDHLTMDFKLRQDVNWSDGKPLTGKDVIFSLKALKNPYNDLTQNKRIYSDAVYSAELINNDPYRVRFHFSRPYFLSKQALFADVLAILPKHIMDPDNVTDQYSWEDIAGSELHKKVAHKLNVIGISPDSAMHAFANWITSDSVNLNPEYLKGSGPYILESWHESEIVFVKNGAYKTQDTTYNSSFGPGRLVYITIPSWDLAIASLLARAIDVMPYIPATNFSLIDTTKFPFIKKTSFITPAYSFIGLNHKNQIFSDPGVRKALIRLIDRKTIIDNVLDGLAQPTNTPVFPLRPEYNGSLQDINFDPEGALRILDSLGWKDTDGDSVLDKKIKGKVVPFEFTFLVNAGNTVRKDILDIISINLKRFGIKANIEEVDWSDYLDRMKDHDFDAYYGAWIMDPYESDFYQLYHTASIKKGSNYDNYSNKGVDKLIEQIRATTNDHERRDLQKGLQEALYNDQAELMLWVPMNCSAWVDRFTRVNWFNVSPYFYPEAWHPIEASN